MSIAAERRKALRSFRSLIDFAMRCVFFIKDLKDLENGTTRVSIDIKVLTDLKRHRLTLDNAGDRPPRYGRKKALREHRDQEVSPTRRASRPGGLSYPACIETGRSLLLAIARGPAIATLSDL